MKLLGVDMKGQLPDNATLINIVIHIAQMVLEKQEVDYNRRGGTAPQTDTTQGYSAAGRGGFRRQCVAGSGSIAEPTVDINSLEQAANDDLETRRESVKRLADTQILDSLFELVDSDLTVL